MTVAGRGGVVYSIFGFKCPVGSCDTAESVDILLDRGKGRGNYLID
jgi:hypothetical protein